MFTMDATDTREGKSLPCAVTAILAWLAGARR